MRVKIFTLPFSARFQNFDTKVLDDFMVNREIYQIEQHFFTHDQKPYLTLILQYDDFSFDSVARSGDTSPNTEAPKKAVDPKELITEKDWPLFDSLRSWRRERSEQDGVPSYIVLKNQQLVDLIQKLPSNLAQLQEIPGIGKGKSEKYGEELLKILTPSQEIKESQVAKEPQKEKGIQKTKKSQKTEELQVAKESQKEKGTKSKIEEI